MIPFDFEIIETPRLQLKQLPLTFDLACHLFEVISSDRHHFKFLPFANVEKPEDEFIFLQKAKKMWEERSTATFGLYIKGQDICFGTCSLNKISWSAGCGEIGYWIDKNYCKKGYVSEAVKGVENFFFQKGFERLFIRANIKNKDSCAIAKRLGYREEGVMRHEIFNTYMNEYEDIAYFGKLRQDWLAEK